MGALTYKDYTAVINYDADEESFHGRVLHINDVVNFYGKSVAELRREMKNSVDVSGLKKLSVDALLKLNNTLYNQLSLERN